jgi:EAL domain-containing protein (putative c-di-GMP-specific phosphodiesterase class I)
LRIELAKYGAKTNGKARCEVFDCTLGARAMQRLGLETDLRRALERNELRVHYQPMVDLTTGHTTEVDALVRWQHLQRGLVSPGDVIPLAEETGLIVPIGQWVLEEARREVQSWQDRDASYPPLRPSLHLSARQLERPDLVLAVARTLRASGLAPASLKLEITETVVMQDALAAIATLRDLKKLGLGLALDDFGTRYSSPA